MPVPAQTPAVVSLNGKIYSIGGNIGTYPDHIPVATVNIFDPINNTWTTGTSMNTARNYHAAAVANGKIYVLGGIGSDGNVLSSVEEFDPATNLWTTKSATGFTERCEHAAASVNGKIYCFGGQFLATKLWNTILQLMQQQ